MPSHHSSKQVVTQPPTDPGSIPDKTESWDDKFELTESNLRNWLLGPFERQRQILEEAKQRMRYEGVSEDLIARSIRYTTLPEEDRKRETLSLTINSKTGKLWDIPTLQNAGKLSNAEIQGIQTEHNNLSPPYYFVTSARRVVDDRQNPAKDYLVYSLQFEGICVGKRDGVINPEPNMRINDSATVGYHLVPRITWETIKDKDGEEKRVATFDSTRTPILNTASSRVHEIPFSMEAVEALLKHTNNGQISLGIDVLSKDKHYGVKDLNEFLIETDKLPVLIDRLDKPRPTNEYNFNLSAQDLADFKRYQLAKEQHGEQQYQ